MVTPRSLPPIPLFQISLEAKRWSEKDTEGRTGVLSPGYHPCSRRRQMQPGQRHLLIIHLTQQLESDSLLEPGHSSKGNYFAAEVVKNGTAEGVEFVGKLLKLLVFLNYLIFNLYYALPNSLQDCKEQKNWKYPLQQPLCFETARSETWFFSR